MAAGNAETGSSEPYVGSDGDSASPYDETTGRIPIQQRPADDRDAFYDRHSRGRMTRVDELDDLDPDEVHTRPFSATPPAAKNMPTGKTTPRAGTSTPPSVASSTPPPAGETGQRRRRRPAPQRDDATTERFESPAAAQEPATPVPATSEPTRGYAEVADPSADSSSERHDTAIIDTGNPGSDPATPEPADTAGFDSAHAHSAHADAAPAQVHADHDDSVAVAEPRARRGTLDLGLLLLRVAVGVVAMAHGLSRLFGWWNGTGLDGFQNELLNPANPAIGFAADAAKPLAAGIALAETIGGLMVIVGLLTPIGASAILAVALLAAAFKTTIAGGFEFFASANGVEFELTMAAAAAAIILTGPGLYSLDYPRGWARRPFVGSVLWLVIGIAVACVIWIFCNGTDPFTSPGNPS
ncbi:DoxX family membrane protein [Gordonia jacobaea]|uniref:DoxX family protein n=1 Tax=Gordonia jacobaea TaxID=122202 RepID=UPI003D764B20